MNGGAGERRKGFSVTALTVKAVPKSAVASEVASSSTSTRAVPFCTPSSLKSRPVAIGWPPSAMRRHRSRPGPPWWVTGRRCPTKWRIGTSCGPVRALRPPCGSRRLDPSGRESRHDLAPEHRRHLVAVEAVEDPAGLLGVDQSPIELAPFVDRPGDGGGGDLVEDHALTGTVGESTSKRCHAMASPSRSSSVAR